MNELMTIQDVRGYFDGDKAYLNLEDVARGLGFVDGNSVRWARVHMYLEEIGYFARSGEQVKPNSATDTFIPENIFYRLAMKAKNETAEIFQAKVADEILPAIRKTGTYSAIDTKLSPELQLARQMLQAMERQELEIQETKAIATAAQSGLEQTRQIISDIKDTVISVPDNWREDINHNINKIVKIIGNKEYQNMRAESYRLLEERARVDLKRRLSNYKVRLMESGASKTTINNANKLDVIEQDTKLREIYAAIIKEYTIKFVA
jgi:prophage antirepressor-like protein